MSELVRALSDHPDIFETKFVIISTKSGILRLWIAKVEITLSFLPGSVQIANNKGTNRKHVGKKGAFSQRICALFALCSEVVQEQAYIYSR